MSDLRDVSVDELFSWRENLGFNSRVLLGNRGYVNQNTYDAIKSRCDVIEKAHWTEAYKFIDLEININDTVPDGVIRPRKLI